MNVLCRYLDNIIGNPEETKFHKIRCSNATFNDKVLPILGAINLLYAAGFRQQKLSVNDVEEDFWVWSMEHIDSFETLQVRVAFILIINIYLRTDFIFFAVFKGDIKIGGAGGAGNRQEHSSAFSRTGCTEDRVAARFLCHFGRGTEEGEAAEVRIPHFKLLSMMYLRENLSRMF